MPTTLIAIWLIISSSVWVFIEHISHGLLQGALSLAWYKQTHLCFASVCVQRLKERLFPQQCLQHPIISGEKRRSKVAAQD